MTIATYREHVISDIGKIAQIDMGNFTHIVGTYLGI
jgi:hypothetical protein